MGKRPKEVQYTSITSITRHMDVTSSVFLNPKQRICIERPECQREHMTPASSEENRVVQFKQT